MSLGISAGTIYVTVSAAVANSAADVLESPDAHGTTDPAETIQTLSTVDDSSTVLPLTADGSLTAEFSAMSIPSGELGPVADIEVTLISADGSKTTDRTDSEGACTFDRLKPGLYTINAAGPQGKLSYGIRAVAGNFAVAQEMTAGQSRPVSVKMAAQIESALTPARDATTLDSVISSVTVDPVEGAAASSGGAAMETGLAANRLATAETYLGHAPIHLTPNGSLEGQLTLLDPVTGNISPVRDLTVSFISDDIVVARTTVNPDGSFVQTNLLPGIYSMVVAGRDGIGYMGIDVVGGVARAGAGKGTLTAVRKMVPFSMGMVRGAGAANNSSDASDSSAPQELSEAGQPSGGGGGGFGELLGLAGLGLGAVALANDNKPGSPAN